MSKRSASKIKLNNFDDLKEDPKINYQYYVTEANKIIAQFKNKQLSLF